MKGEREQSSWGTVETSQRYIESITAQESREIKITKENYHDPVFYAFLPELEDKRVVDIACGNFYMDMALKGIYPSATVIGVDFPEMLQSATDAYQEQNRGKFKTDVELVGGNASQLPFADNSIDVTMSSLLYHWNPSAKETTEEMHRILKPGGLVVVSLIHPDTFKAGKFKTEDGINYTFERTRDTSEYQEIDVMLNQTIGPVIYYQRPVDEYRQMFEEAGFENVTIREPKFTDQNKMQEYDHLRRYRAQPLYLFVTATKSVK